MFIKIKRTQVCTSGHYVSGVTYEIDPKNHLQMRDAEHLVKRGFAAEVDNPKAKKAAAAKKKPSNAAAKVEDKAKNEPADDKVEGGVEAKAGGADTKQIGA